MVDGLWMDDSRRSTINHRPSTMSAGRPTIIIVHPKERRSKCTVLPLRGREGFVFWKHPRRGPELTGEYVRLGFGGPEIGPDDAGRGLLILDGTWRLAAAMERDFADVPVRSLPELRTAYPRVSKTRDDPHGGLATIEALFAAYFLSGRETEGLLDEYHWADDFLEANRDVFGEIQHEAAESTQTRRD
jgi:rRNA small subunit aminocarboxypropyltransferase